MAFPEDNLNDDEEVVLNRRPHWTFLLGPIGLLILGLFAFIFFLALAPGFWWAGLAILVLAILSFGVNFLKWRTIQFVVTTDRIITRVGIIAKAGTEIPLDRVMNISYRQSVMERVLGVGDLVIESAGENGQQFFSDISHPSHVQNIIYRQTEIYTQRGPNNGLGDDSAPAPKRSGDNSSSSGRNRSRSPLSADNGGLSRRDSQEESRVGGSNGHGTPSNGDQGEDGNGGGGADIPGQIEALDRLRQRGILTDDEFRSKKKELLDRL